MRPIPPATGTGRLRLLLAAIAMLAGNACVSPPATKQPAHRGTRGAEVARVCTIRASSGFQQLAANSVLLTISPKRQYLIDTIGSCPDLDSAFSIGFDTWDRCLSPGDKIIIPPAFSSRPPRTPTPSCRVRRIYDWQSPAAQSASIPDTKN